MDKDLSNIKCIIFRDKQDYSLHNIIKFNNRTVAQQYYKIAHRRHTFAHTDTFDRCIKWCEKNKNKYIVIERSEFNSSD